MSESFMSHVLKRFPIHVHVWNFAGSSFGVQILVSADEKKKTTLSVQTTNQ
jgi:hypothetical protein